MTQRAPNEDAPARQHLPEPSEWLERYGDVLYRFALARLRRPHEAEEVVQEALLAALQARRQFKGRSHPRTWLVGILKRKILDRLRTTARTVPRTNLPNLDAWFNDRGKWRKPLGRWEDPTDHAERSEFWEILRRCLAKLPTRMAAAFTLRTVDDSPPTDVCRELEISPNNLWVLLHRARLQLARCLQSNGLDAEEPRC
jgi:RNA polymerase sigma-70 factor (TIGR02943 family)